MKTVFNGGGCGGGAFNGGGSVRDELRIGDAKANMAIDTSGGG